VAIARVNRVFDDLRDALQTYAREVGEDRVPVRQIQDEALPVMQREFEQLRSFGRGYEWSVNGATLAQAAGIDLRGSSGWSVMATMKLLVPRRPRRGGGWDV
jgi:hypothetical protein